MSAFAKGYENKGQEKMVFDWVAAAQKIREIKPKIAKAGLQGDFENTGGIIYEDGKINTKSYTYLASGWARPILILDDVVYECFLMEEQTKYNKATKWPQEAINILEGES